MCIGKSVWMCAHKPFLSWISIKKNVKFELANIGCISNILCVCVCIYIYMSAVTTITPCNSEQRNGKRLLMY